MGGQWGVATTRSCLVQDYPTIDWLVIAYRWVALVRIRNQVKAVRAANFMRQPGGARGAGGLRSWVAFSLFCPSGFDITVRHRRQ